MRLANTNVITDFMVFPLCLLAAATGSRSGPLWLILPSHLFVETALGSATARVWPGAFLLPSGGQTVFTTGQSLLALKDAANTKRRLRASNLAEPGLTKGGRVMTSRLPLLTIENILRNYLQPFRCDCHAQEDSRVTVRLYEEQLDGEELTVFGITDEQCRDATNLVRLAQELRFELYATRGGLMAEADPVKIAER
jgi:hypothetical protein